jgi:hypothetical protein
LEFLGEDFFFFELTPGNIFESQTRLVFVIEKDKMLGAPSSIYMYLDDIEIGEYLELGA